jgi:hypothetical protein
MIPAALWVLIAVLAAMVLVPWGMLRLVEHVDRDPDRAPRPIRTARPLSTIRAGRSRCVARQPAFMPPTG